MGSSDRPRVIQLVSNRLRGNSALPEITAHLSFPSLIMVRDRVKMVAWFSSFWLLED